MYKLPKSRSQLSYISNTRVKFKFFMVEAYQKYHIKAIVGEFKIVMLEVDHTLNIYDIGDDFKNDMVEVGHKFGFGYN